MSDTVLPALKIPVTAIDHRIGPDAAKITLVEYGDYQCPHCAHAFPIVQGVRRHFGDDLRFVFRNFPLTRVHPFAEPAAELAEFAGANSKFWEMHDVLFENQPRLDGAILLDLVRQLGLSTIGARDALDTGLYRSRVRTDFSGGVRSGVNGTPTFFVNGHRHDAPVDALSLTVAIEHALAEAGS